MQLICEIRLRSIYVEAKRFQFVLQFSLSAQRFPFSSIYREPVHSIFLLHLFYNFQVCIVRNEIGKS